MLASSGFTSFFVHQLAQTLTIGGRDDSQIPQLGLPALDHELIPVIVYRIAEAEIAAFNDAVRTLNVAAKAILHAIGCNRIVVIRGDEIRDRDAVGGISKLRILARVAYLNQINHPVEA